MSDNKESATRGVADRDVPPLSNRMIGIFKSGGQRIVEHSNGFVERYAVFSEIALGLLRIPFELHRDILEERSTPV